MAADERTFRIVEVHSYLDREEEWRGLSLDEAAARMDDLTSVGADTILADFNEDCTLCHGTGAQPNNIFDDCSACAGTARRGDPWEWVDEETGREVTLRLEVE